MEYRAWTAEREKMEATIGPLDLDTVVEKMLSIIQAWEAVSRFAERIFMQKEAQERAQQMFERNTIRV